MSFGKRVVVHHMGRSPSQIVPVGNNHTSARVEGTRSKVVTLNQALFEL